MISKLIQHFHQEIMSKVKTPESKEEVAEQEEKAASVTNKGMRFNGICKYVGITGNQCGKRCVREDRCAQHKDTQSYTNKCKAADCTRMTNSSYGYCSHHNHFKKPDTQKADHPDEVKELQQKLKDLGFQASVRKARPSKKQAQQVEESEAE